MLAHDIIRAAPAGRTLTAFTREQLDVRDAVTLERAVERSEATWLFNCAGLTNVDVAQLDREAAFAVNATAVEHMANACRRHDVNLLHFSTDYVFDGRNTGFYSEDDPPHPINVYGESKLAGERAVEQSGAHYLMVRTQWLFGTRRRSFVGLMSDRARARQRTRVVVDQVGCCTYTVDLAAAVWQLVDSAQGLVHVANRGKVSRYALAARVFEHFGARDLVEGCSAADFSAAAPRPASSALSVRRAEHLLGYELPTWQDALQRYFVEAAASIESRGIASAR